MGCAAWLRLLTRNRFAIAPSCWHWAITISVAAVRNTFFHGVQEMIWGRRIKQTRIVHAPVFVIGHWRSGTTLLHELLALDERHACPTTYECIFPSHFLVTERWFTRWYRFLMPPRRPVDRMRMGWTRPQEDEFALCNLGQSSPYLTIAFPNRGPQCDDYFDLEQVPADARQRWKECYLRFIRQLTVRDSRRVVLKSPTHTFRIRLLLDLFPDARFVHIVRNPYVIFPSTISLWRSLYTYQGLQRPTFEGLEEYVFDTFVRLHARLDETRSLVAPSRFCEVRYEDLIADPVGQVRAIYQQLDLGDVEPVLPALRRHVAEIAVHTPNRHELPPALLERITERWGHVIRRYGYSYPA